MAPGAELLVVLLHSREVPASYGNHLRYGNLHTRFPVSGSQALPALYSRAGGRLLAPTATGPRRNQTNGHCDPCASASGWKSCTVENRFHCGSKSSTLSISFCVMCVNGHDLDHSFFSKFFLKPKSRSAIISRKISTGSLFLGWCCVDLSKGKIAVVGESH